jgi:hypothetical protein
MTLRWKFTTYDSHEKIAEDEATMSEEQARETVRLLAARHLTEREIVEEMARGGRNLLDVRRDEGAKSYSLTCGNNPHCTARRMDE